LTIGIAQAAARLGAIIRERSSVTRIIPGRELSAEIGGDRIRPGHVVVATNAWINATLADTPPLNSSLTFGRRGHASLRSGKQLLIRLDSGQWQVQQESLGGWEIVARDWGRKSLRAYLIKDSPPPHPLFEKK